jgi:hypothetical protein
MGSFARVLGGNKTVFVQANYQMATRFTDSMRITKEPVQYL